jgi:hypothetical protein
LTGAKEAHESSETDPEKSKHSEDLYQNAGGHDRSYVIDFKGSRSFGERQGPYGVVRNPLYWSVVFVMLGEAAVFHSPPLADCAIVYFVVACLRVLVFEEPELRRTFGAEYKEYCKRVPRWLPRLRSK